MKIQSLSFAFVASMVALACNAQVGPDHQGEPLLVVHGQVVPNGKETPPPAEAALLWFGAPGPTSLGYTGTTVPVTGNFPVGFEIHAFSPPPDAAFLTKDHSFAVGYIVALAPNVDHASVGPADVLGASLDTLVIYLGDDIEPESEMGRAISSAGYSLKAGYQILALAQPTRAEYDAQLRCFSRGVCPRVHVDPGLGKPGADLEAVAEIQYKDCRDAVPEATTCDAWFVVSQTSEQKTETLRCQAILDARDGKDENGKDCATAARPTPFAAGGTVTVTMGANPWHRRP